MDEQSVDDARPEPDPASELLEYGRRIIRDLLDALELLPADPTQKTHGPPVRRSKNPRFH